MEDDEFVQPTASIFDKTDWRKTIHKCLEACVMREDTKYYPQAVKSLISAVSASFPGFDAREMITKEIMEIKKEYKEWTKNYFVKNPDYWHHPIKRKIIYPQILNSYYKDIFTYIFNLLAKKRMLLWGAVESMPVSYDELEKYTKQNY